LHKKSHEESSHPKQPWAGGEQQPTSLVGDWRISNQNGSNIPISRMQSKQFQESQWNMNTKIRSSIVDLCG
jgi:hypothetical protein